MKLHHVLFTGVCLLGIPSLALGADEGTKFKEVVVTAEKEEEKHLPDVEGTKIYSGKKTSVIDLEEPPTIINNNFRQALQKTPGLLLSEEAVPLFSVGYRGLEPHRGQFTQVLKDGIPIHADMFGYPEAYYTPALQTIDRIDFIRGGASLMYGPQPGGALNFVTKDPYEAGPLSITQENAAGSYDFFSNYTSLSGTQGPLGYYGYFHHRQSQGFRAHNSQYEVYYGGTKFKVEQDPSAYWTVVFDSYNEEHGEPGGLTRADFDADPTKTNRLNDHFELNRYAGSLAYTKEIDPQTSLEAKTYGGTYERLSWRQRTSGSNFGQAPSGTNAATNDIESQKFYTVGSEARIRHDYEALGADNTVTGGILYHHVVSPRIDKRGTTPDAEEGTVRKDADREMNYVSLFLENMYKVGKLSITPGVRLENIWQSIRENINLDKTTLADESIHDFVPLFGVGTQYELTQNTELYHNISQSYRPKIFTQAVPTGSGQIINDDLEEGKSWQTDLGLRGQPTPYLSWDGSVFYMSFTDQIGTVNSVVQNVGDAQHYGFEFASEVDLIGLADDMRNTELGAKVGKLNAFANVMFLHAEFTEGPNSGKTPQYAPDYITRAGLEYNYLDKAKVRLAGTFVDDHFADDGNTANFNVPSYKVWDLTGEFNIYKDEVKLFAGINNLFDEQYFARVRSDGIDPAAGRNYYGGVEFIW